MGLSRQKYWSELPFPPPEDLPNPGIKPTSPPLAGGFFTTGATRDDFTLSLTCVMGLSLTKGWVVFFLLHIQFRGKAASLHVS